MSNYVLKYTRDERVRYISHLDFMRMFHRAVRRSGLPFAFSQGFNPHPIMTVAMPLSVGVTSEGELMKVGFEGDYTPEELVSRLNQFLPEGFRVLAAQKAEGKEFDFAKLDRAVYETEVELTREYTPDMEAFLARETMLVMKRSKSGVKEADIRPHLFSLGLKKMEGKICTFRICVSASNQYNLKPDTVVEAMEKYIPGFQPEFVCSHRVALLSGEKEYL